MVKAVIFDLDNTLCNTTDVIEDALRSTFVQHLIYFPDKNIDDLILLNIKTFENLIADPYVPLSSATIRVWFEVFEQLQIKPSLKIILQIIEHVRNEVNKRVRLIDGVLELMSYLRSKDIKIGVLSNGIFIDQASKLIELKIDDFVDYLVTSDMYAADKPDPKIFKYLLNKMSISPNQTLMIGDDLLADIKGGHDIGIRTIYLIDGESRNVDTKLVKPDYIESNYRDILRLVIKLTSNQK